MAQQKNQPKDMVSKSDSDSEVEYKSTTDTEPEPKPKTSGGVLGFGGLFRKRFEEVCTEDQKDADYEWIEHKDALEEDMVDDESEEEGWTKWEVRSTMKK